MLSSDKLNVSASVNEIAISSIKVGCDLELFAAEALLFSDPCITVRNVCTTLSTCSCNCTVLGSKGMPIAQCDQHLPFWVVGIWPGRLGSCGSFCWSREFVWPYTFVENARMNSNRNTLLQVLPLVSPEWYLSFSQPQNKFKHSRQKHQRIRVAMTEWLPSAELISCTAEGGISSHYLFTTTWVIHTWNVHLTDPLFLFLSVYLKQTQIYSPESTQVYLPAERTSRKNDIHWSGS